jgi:Fe-S-cluster containining protein
MSDEIGLFSPNLVSPFYAVGPKEAQTVLSYQLNVNVCPHLGENKECAVYESRPISCRAFPAAYSRRRKWTLSEKCPATIQKMKDKEQHALTGRIEEIRAIPEMEAAERLWWYRLNQLEQYVGFLLWIFDLDLQGWMVIGRVQDALSSV